MYSVGEDMNRVYAFERVVYMYGTRVGIYIQMALHYIPYYTTSRCNYSYPLESI